METLIKTIEGINGKLYATIGGRRTILAECAPRVNIYEHSVNIPTLGVRSYKVKSTHCAVVICPSPETAHEVDTAFFERVTRFDFVGDFQRLDGVFERITLEGIVPDELDLSEDWQFNVVGNSDIVKRLAGF